MSPKTKVLVWRSALPISLVPRLDSAFGSSSGLGLLETCCFWTKNKITICLSFPFSLLVSAGFPSLLCLERSAVWVFIRSPCLSHLAGLPRLPWQGQRSSPSSMLENNLCFSPVCFNFLPLWFASVTLLQPGRKSKHPETSKTFTNPGFLSAHYHYSIMIIIFCSTEAGLYVHIFDLRWIIAAEKE